MSQQMCNDETDQHRTTVGHCKIDDCDVYVGRGFDGEAMGTVAVGQRGWLGNPYVVDEDSEAGYTREESVALFTTEFLQKLEDDIEFRNAVGDLEGATLGCWCQREHEDDGDLCHGEVIARAVDRVLVPRS